MGCRQPRCIQLTFLVDGRLSIFVVRRFEGATLEGGTGHGQQAWAAQREKFKAGSCEVIRAEHAEMNNAPMSFEQDPDLYIMDSGRDRLDACDPPEVQHIANTRIIFFESFHQRLTPYVNHTWREGTSALPISCV